MMNDERKTFLSFTSAFIAHRSSFILNSAFLQNFSDERFLECNALSVKMEVKTMAVVTCLECGAKNRVDERAAQSRQPVCGRCGAALRLNTDATGKPRTVTDATFAREVKDVRGVP